MIIRDPEEDRLAYLAEYYRQRRTRMVLWGVSYVAFMATVVVVVIESLR